MQINLGKPHYASTHGKLGLAATAAAFVAAAGGGVAFRKLGVLQRVPVWLQGRLKQAHRLAGPAVLAAAYANVFIGLGTHGAGPRTALHLWQRGAVVLLGLAQAWLLWGGMLCRRLGLTRCGKTV